VAITQSDHRHMVGRQLMRQCLLDKSTKQLCGLIRHAPDTKQRHSLVTLTTTSRFLPPWFTASAMLEEMIFAMRFRIHGADAACIASMSTLVKAWPSHCPAVCIINRTRVRQHTRHGQYTGTQTHDPHVVILQNGQCTNLPAFA